MNTKLRKFLCGFFGFNIALQVLLPLVWWSIGGFGGDAKEIRYGPLGVFESVPVTRDVGFYDRGEYLGISLLLGLFGGIVTGFTAANYDPEKEQRQREYWSKTKQAK